MAETETAFDRAKRSTLLHLQSIINFTVSLDKQYPGYGFNIHVNTLTGISNKIKGSVRPSLTLDEVDKFERLLAQLTSHYRFKDKLSALAELCVKIARAVFIDGTLNLDVAKIEQNMNKFILVSDVTTDALQAIRKDNASILSIM